MGHKHSREEILDGALAVALDVGLARLTFGRVASALGISDRVVVYYFPTKDDLVGDVVLALGLRLQAALDGVATTPFARHRDLVTAVWPVVATAEADPVFAVFFEANGLAAVGRPPYDTLVPALVEAWVAWAADRLVGDEAHRRTEAETAIALIDGLLLLRLLAGADAAERVAANLGVRPPVRATHPSD